MKARWGTHPLRSELGVHARAGDAALSVTAQLLRLLAATCFAMFASAAQGHAASTAYLDIGAPMAGTVDVQWAVALRDLDAVLDLDADSDGTLTWSEVVARRADIERTTRDAVRFTSGNVACTLEIAPPRFTQLDSGGYAVVNAKALCPTTADHLQLDYRFLQRIDATHRVLLSTPTSATPRPVAPNERVDVALTVSGASAAGRATTRAVDFRALLANGVTHIVTGIDHLLFLVALLLPAVMRRTGDRWVARAQLKPALVEVVWIATAFTTAHSLTLGLASFHVIAIPARVIEPLIAATVLAAALNNLKPIVTQRVAAVAFCFGLIHGFGFAEVLAPLNLPAPELAVALFGFNLGVEIGQLAIIGCAFALLALARRWFGYGRWVLGAGSAMLALTASVWMVERIFDVPLFALALAR
jgi:hypothetical protein